MAQKKKKRTKNLQRMPERLRYVPQRMMEPLKETMKRMPNQKAAKMVVDEVDKYKHLTNGADVKAAAGRFGTVEKMGYVLACAILESYKRVGKMEAFWKLMKRNDSRSRYVAYNFGVLARNSKTSDDKALTEILEEAGGFNYEEELLKEREWMVPITGALLSDMQTNMIAHWAKTLTSEQAYELVHRIHLLIFDSFVAAAMGGFRDWPIFPMDIVVDEEGEFLEKYDIRRKSTMGAHAQKSLVLDDLRAKTPPELLLDTETGQKLFMKIMALDEAAWHSSTRNGLTYAPQVGIYDSRMVPPKKAENGLDFFGMPAMFDFFPQNDDHYRSFVFGTEMEDFEATAAAIIDELLARGGGRIPFPDGRSLTLKEIEENEDDEVAFKLMVSDILSLHYDYDNELDDDEVADPEKLNGNMRPPVEMLRAAANSERELYAMEIARVKRERQQEAKVRRLEAEAAQAGDRKKAESTNRLPSDKSKIEAQKARISKLEELLREERERAEGLERRLTEAEDENRVLQQQLDTAGEEEPAEEGLDKSILDGKRIVVIGGHSVWCSAMEAFHESITVFPGEGIKTTFDERVLQKADAVWFQPNKIGHPTYYRVMHAVKAAGLPCFFFKYAGHGACENQLIKEMEAFAGSGLT